MTNLSTLLASNMPSSVLPFIFILVGIVVLIIGIPIIRNVIIAKKAGRTGTTKSKKTGEEAPFCRWCPDVQPVVDRTEEQRNIVDKYFIVKNVKHYNKPLFIFGVLMLITGVILGVIGAVGGITALLIVGIIVVVVGVILIIAYKKTVRWVPPADMISHEQYEKLVSDKIKSFNVEKRGLEHLGLDEEQVREIKPLVFTGREIKDYSLVAFKNKIHSSTQTVTLVYFTDEQLFLYKLTFDMTCNKQEELTSEFFYVDICDVSTAVEKNILEIGGSKVEDSTIDVNVIAQNSNIHISMENDEKRFASIQAMRQKVRERKMRS